MNRIIDLTQMITPDIPVYPGTETPNISSISSVETDKFLEHNIHITSHTGTHIDAPAHIFSKGKGINNYEVSGFIGKGICIDCSQCKEISKEYIEPLISKYETFDFILLNTGISVLWESKGYAYELPQLMPGAAQLLASQHIKGVGIDAISVESSHSENLEIHNCFLKNEILIIENLTNLNLLLNVTFTLICLPLRTICQDGSPARVIAITDDE